MTPVLDFTGKTALVMGASKGIGLATAQVLAGLGATVVLAARNGKALDEAVSSIIHLGGHAKAKVCDVSCYDEVEATVQYCLAETGRIDMLINNAGVIEPLTHLIDSDPAIWGTAADINFKGVYFGMRAVLPHMVESGQGVVVNMSSGAANSDLPGWSHYCSTKAAAKKLTEVAHRELIGTNVRVVGLSPGTVATEMMAKIKAAEINVVSELEWSSHISPKWVGKAVAFLCGPEGEEYAGTDFSLKTPEGRARVGLSQ